MTLAKQFGEHCKGLLELDKCFISLDSRNLSVHGADHCAEQPLIS